MLINLSCVNLFCVPYIHLFGFEHDSTCGFDVILAFDEIRN